MMLTKPFRVGLLHYRKTSVFSLPALLFFRTHGVTKERLASYERKITAEPFLVQCDLGSLIADLEHYLDILKDVHDSLDLKVRFSVDFPQSYTGF